ncbi:hypothetical protein FRC09_009797, partial [Ceratobasidium sp. 395]
MPNTVPQEVGGSKYEATALASDEEESDGDDTEGSEAETTEGSEEEGTHGPEEGDTVGSEAEVEEALQAGGVVGSEVNEAERSAKQIFNPGSGDAVPAARDSESGAMDTSAGTSAR